MQTLDFVTNQLESVDWGRHGEVMECVDAEVSLVSHKVSIIITLYSMLADLDRLMLDKISKGELAVDTKIQEGFSRAMEGFKSASTQVFTEAMEFTRQGFPINNLGVLKNIVSNPTVGLELLQIVQLANALPRDGEVEIPEETFERVARSGQEYRNVG